MPDVRLRYKTFEFADFDLHVRTLRDTQQFDDDDAAAEDVGIDPSQWGIFGVLWESSHALAHLMVDFDVEGKRILEVGCGIGLASLVLNRRNANITATDHHPEAGNFLTANTELNGDQAIPFVRTAWNDDASGMGAFDLIIGSDVLYERDHVTELAGFIDRHARATCDVILIGQNRGHRGAFSKEMTARGYDHSRRAAGPSAHHEGEQPLKILSYSRATPSEAS